jgi:uncharacterized membrane protein YbaN (DUF454 family)
VPPASRGADVAARPKVRERAPRLVDGLRRGVWLVAGILAVAIGGLGVIVPGLPTTPFFIVAAWCFSRSSPRLEQWVLDLKGIGPLVRDHRSGLGVPRRVKVLAISMMAVAVTLSATIAVQTTVPRLAIVGLGLAGFAYVTFVIPTRERVLAGR